MSDRPEDFPAEEPDEFMLQGQVQHHPMTALVPAEVAAGVLSNGVMILVGPFEVMLDFVMRIGERQRHAARIILNPLVAAQLVVALQENIQAYEKMFGTLPKIPSPLPVEPDEEVPIEPSGVERVGGEIDREQELHRLLGEQPHIDEIYKELNLNEQSMMGKYANSVLIRHSPTEFCFDFISNTYPRSVVTSRVFLSTPHVATFLKSLSMSIHPPKPPEGFDGTRYA